jgi:hypothetical protein
LKCGNLRGITKTSIIFRGKRVASTQFIASTTGAIISGIVARVSSSESANEIKGDTWRLCYRMKTAKEDGRPEKFGPDENGKSSSRMFEFKREVD